MRTSSIVLTAGTLVSVAAASMETRDEIDRITSEAKARDTRAPTKQNRP